MARPMQLSELRTEVYNRLAETAGFFTNAQINQWLNDGMDEVAMAVEPLVTTATQDITADTREYLLPDALISIKQVHFLDSDSVWHLLSETTYEDLFEQHPDWEDSANTADPPRQWYWRQDVLGLYPTPSTTRNAACRILYTCRPSEMLVDTAKTGMPSWLDRAVITFALYRCLLKDNQSKRAVEAITEFNRLVHQAQRNMNKIRKDHAPKMEPRSSDYRTYYRRPRYDFITVDTS